MRPPEIIDAALPEGLLGFTDGVSRIWLDQQLTTVDRRVVLEHELVHYARGHRGHCIAVIEHGIDCEVATGSSTSTSSVTPPPGPPRTPPTSSLRSST